MHSPRGGQKSQPAIKKFFKEPIYLTWKAAVEDLAAIGDWNEVRVQGMVDREVEGQLADRAGKYLSIELGREQFGVPVSRIREIIGYQEVCGVPNTAAHVKGVINLRGKVIPIVDLRSKFGMAEKEHSERTCIIVIALQRKGVSMHMGAIVDGVSDVINLSCTDLEPAPDFGDGRRLPFLAGIAKLKDRVVILLDIDEALNGSEASSMGSLLAGV